MVFKMLKCKNSFCDVITSVLYKPHPDPSDWLHWSHALNRVLLWLLQHEVAVYYSVATVGVAATTLRSQILITLDTQQPVYKRVLHLSTPEGHCLMGAW